MRRMRKRVGSNGSFVESKELPKEEVEITWQEQNEQNKELKE